MPGSFWWIVVLLCSWAPLAAQTMDSVAVPARDTVAVPASRAGIWFRSVQGEYIYGGTIRVFSVSADLDMLETSSRPPFGFGVRGGIETAQSMSLLDYEYSWVAGNLLARMSVGNRWLRFDLYGGYTFRSYRSSGFAYPMQPRQSPTTHHTLTVGSQIRVAIAPPVLALTLGYFSGIEHPFANQSRLFESGGLGLLLGWQW